MSAGPLSITVSAAGVLVRRAELRTVPDTPIESFAEGRARLAESQPTAA